jgi:hypothetical protein
MVPKIVETIAEEKAIIKLFNKECHKSSDCKNNSLYQTRLNFVNSEPLLSLNEYTKITNKGINKNKIVKYKTNLEKENFKCPVFFQARLACLAFSDFGLLALNA